jgi:hypothetical protein
MATCTVFAKVTKTLESLASCTWKFKLGHFMYLQKHNFICIKWSFIPLPNLQLRKYQMSPNLWVSINFFRNLTRKLVSLNYYSMKRIIFCFSERSGSGFLTNSDVSFGWFQPLLFSSLLFFLSNNNNKDEFPNIGTTRVSSWDRTIVMFEPL